MWEKLKLSCREHPLVVAIFAALFLIILVLLNYFSKFPHARSADQAVWGQFGDYFGGILNPILSFTALVGLLVTLRTQQEEARKTDGRHKQQTFDSRLFQLLSLSHEAVSAVKYVYSDGSQREVYEGHRGVAYALNRLQEEYLYSAQRESDRLYERLGEQYEEWKKLYWSGVASYIESMLFILKYVIQGAENHEFALRAVLAQMSSDEKLLVFYVMIFTPNQSLLLSKGLVGEFMSGASADDLLPFRQKLLISAAMNRLSPKL